MVPTGGAGKKFINEIARLLNLWTNDTRLKKNILKEIYIIPALLLQKPSKKSKARKHLNALERQMKLWKKVTSMNGWQKAKQYKKGCHQELAQNTSFQIIRFMFIRPLRMICKFCQKPLHHKHTHNKWFQN